MVNHETQKTVFPDASNDKLSFKNVENQLPVPFYFVADFECILEKYDTCAPDPKKSSTTPLNKHTVCGAAYNICCRDKRYFKKPQIFIKEENGKSITTQFLDSIINDAREIKETLEYITPMKDLTLEQLAIFNSPNAECHICEKIFPNI